MQTSARLPLWLDDLVFSQMDAKYKRSNCDMTVIDWDKNDIKNYLGTYFPRSYVESFCIFQEYFSKNPAFLADREILTVFDFGCGTGGEIIGLLSCLSNTCPNLRKVEIHAFDGNKPALRELETVIGEASERVSFEIKLEPIQVTIEDFYDMEILDRCVASQYDIIMTFKAICEFVTKERFEQANAYAHFAKTFLPHLSEDGIMLIEDVTTYNNTSNRWLPKMLDSGLRDAGCEAAMTNYGYNQTFTVSHSRHPSDQSKVAWRIINK